MSTIIEMVGCSDEDGRNLVSRTRIVDLPVTIYHSYLFNYFHLDDIWDLRLISKMFYSIVKSYDLEKLTFTNVLNKSFWFSTSELDNFRNQIDIVKLPLLKNPANNLLNLKYLKIDQLSKSIQLKDLNRFSKLQVLEIVQTNSLTCGVLKLPKLRALSIGHYTNGLKEIVIDAPNLHSLQLKFVYMSKIAFKYPLSIKYLALNQFDAGVTVFSNVQCLEIRANEYTRSFYSLNRDNLCKFKNLKEFKICYYTFIDSHLLAGSSSTGTDELKNLLIAKNLNMYLEGVNVNRVGKYFGTKSILEYQLKYNEKLEDDLRFHTRFNFNTLLRLLPNNQPSDLFRKYTNIQQIKIYSKIKDENRLNAFIKQCPLLSKLHIEKSSLTQRFYDQLPKISLLSKLYIKDEAEVTLNFRFILKLYYLVVFKTDKEYQLDHNLFLNNLKHLKYFSFVIDSKEFTIIKMSYDRYKISDCKELGIPEKEYFSFDELVEWSKYLKGTEEVKGIKEVKKSNIYVFFVILMKLALIILVKYLILPQLKLVFNI